MMNAFRNLYRMHADDGRILGFATGENEQKAFERFRDASNFKGNMTALQMTFGYPSDVCEVVKHNVLLSRVRFELCRVARHA